MALLEDCPHGVRLLKTIAAHTAEITTLSWCRDASGTNQIISGSTDSSVRLWNVATGALIREFFGHTQTVDCSLVTPDGKTLYTGSWDQTIRGWNIGNGKPIAVLSGHQGSIWQIALLPGGEILASASSDRTIKLWSLHSAADPITLKGHEGAVYCVTGLTAASRTHLVSGSSDKTIKLWNLKTHEEVWSVTTDSVIHSIISSDDGKVIYTGAEDGSIGVWETSTGKRKEKIVSHDGTIKNLTLSNDGKLLISKATDSTIRFWNTSNWKLCAALTETFPGHLPSGLALQGENLASLGDRHSSVRIWDIDTEILLSQDPKLTIKTAAVVFLGDSGSGKSALINSLSGLAFQPTESTHGRALRRIQLPRQDSAEIRELVLWDLAGQPAYRSIHQLYLPDAAVIVLVFDPRSEASPMQGIRYWSSVIRQLQLRKSTSNKTFKILVAARADLINFRPSPEMLKTLEAEEGFDGSTIASAKNGEGLVALYKLITAAIDWSKQPSAIYNNTVSALHTLLWQHIGRGIEAITLKELLESFSHAHSKISITEKGLLSNLEQIEQLGVILVLRKKGLVLLRPELLDHCAAAIAESAMANGGYYKFNKSILNNVSTTMEPETLKILFEICLQDMIDQELAIENLDSLKPYSFPTYVLEGAPKNLGDRICTMFFSGSASHVFATLVVRLARSVDLSIKHLWKLAATFSSRLGGGSEFSLQCYEINDSQGEIAIYRNKSLSSPGDLSGELSFLEVVSSHLEQLAMSGTIRVFVPTFCRSCSWELPASLQRSLAEVRINVFLCPRCKMEVGVETLSI